MTTAKKFKVHYLRHDRCYVIVTDSGREIARVDEITEAWGIAEQMEREAAARAAARRRTAAEAGVVQARRMRSAAARVRRIMA